MVTARRINAQALLLLAVALFPFLLVTLRLSQSLEDQPHRRRLSEQKSSSNSASSAADRQHDLERILSLANRSPEDAFTDGDSAPFRVLYVVTMLVGFDTGLRGTTPGSDRLTDLVLPVLADGVASMVARGWEVDVYLICGYATLLESRRRMIADALPPGVGLEVWTDAIPYYYVKRWNQELKRTDQLIELAPHALSRQHRFVVRDKLMEYDFFAAFEDDMRITADHIMNFLEMSTALDRARREADRSPDGRVRVPGAAKDRGSARDKGADPATTNHDAVEGPLAADELRRLWPGFLRAEVLDARGKEAHPLLDGVDPALDGADPALDRYRWREEVPPAMTYEVEAGALDPAACCGVPPGGARTPDRPRKDDLLLWETDVGAMGVRRYPGVGWAAAMTVKAGADVGSYGSESGRDHHDSAMRLLGQQAGWMATRSQVLYFHEHACPGGFLPPFDGEEWLNDSLQTKNGEVEFWSGGYQLLKCSFNRILSLDPKRYSRQILYHSSNNKQFTKDKDKFIRHSRFLGQLYTLKERALKSLMG